MPLPPSEKSGLGLGSELLGFRDDVELAYFFHGQFRQAVDEAEETVLLGRTQNAFRQRAELAVVLLTRERARAERMGVGHGNFVLEGAAVVKGDDDAPAERDRKSTRLNSSHVAISYAVFGLKKKRKSTHMR